MTYDANNPACPRCGKEQAAPPHRCVFWNKDDYAPGSNCTCCTTCAAVWCSRETSDERRAELMRTYLPYEERHETVTLRSIIERLEDTKCPHLLWVARQYTLAELLEDLRRVK